MRTWVKCSTAYARQRSYWATFSTILQKRHYLLGRPSWSSSGSSPSAVCVRTSRRVSASLKTASRARSCPHHRDWNPGQGGPSHEGGCDEREPRADPCSTGGVTHGA